MSTILKSCTSWYNPFTCNGRELDAIHIIKDGAIIRSTRWFDYSNQMFKLVEFPWEAKVKRNIDLNSKVAFLISKKNCLGEKVYEFYIPIHLLDDVEIGEEVAQKEDYNKTSIHYTTALSFTLPKFELKHPDHPLSAKVTGRVTCTSHRWADTDFGKRIKKLREIAESKGVNLTTYDFEKLLDVFNITVKRK